MKSLLLTLLLLLVAAPAVAHERGEYNEDDPSTYACAVTPDNHRHVEDVCYDGHDLEDCGRDERDADGWCLSEQAPTYTPPPEVEVIHDPEGITGEPVVDPDHEPEPFEVVTPEPEPVESASIETVEAPEIHFRIISGPSWFLSYM